MKKRASSAGGVQMFSFLDAMICTLGALLVLLHAFARHGQIEVVRKAETKAAQQSPAELEADLELAQWRAEQLKLVRDKTEAELADERLKLAHLEDHARRLQEKLVQLKIAAAELARSNESSEEQKLRDQQVLEEAQLKLAEARHAVEEARKQSRRKASYSVVPYEGPNPTHRRPIYIECREDAMVLQPEGIELTPRDFSGVLGAGNPLASALRGAGEYFARRTPPGKTESDPYPLLLVRPEGVKTYYAARSALESWGSDFGYELIGSDWELKYAEPDDRLAQLYRQIVADARVRMRELAMAMADLHASRQAVRLHASSRGGFVVERGPHATGSGRPGDDGGGWDTLDSQWAQGGAGSGTGRGTGGDARNGVGGAPVGGMGAGSAYAGPPQFGGSGHAGPAGSRYFGASAGQTGTGGFGGDGSLEGAGGTGEGPHDSAFAGNSESNHGPGGKAGTSPGQPGSPYGTTQTGRAGGPDGQLAQGHPGGTSQGTGNSPSGSHGEAGEHSPYGEAGTAQSGTAEGAHGPGGANSGGSSSSASSASSSAGGDAASTATAPVGMPHPSFGQPHRTPQSLAKVRGRDWGLPDGGMGMSPATRPILVECHPDRLVIVPDDKRTPRRVTQLGDEAQENIDEFVSNVWDHMKSWGIAGRGLYWRPTLIVAVAPGADVRFAEVKALLADSGLEVRERETRAAENARPTSSRR